MTDNKVLWVLAGQLSTFAAPTCKNMKLAPSVWCSGDFAVEFLQLK